LSKLTPLSFFCMHCDLNMIASHLKSATLSLADLRIRYWNSNFEHDQKDSQSWFFSSNLKTKVVCSVWPQNCRMAAWLVTSQSAPKDGVLLCEVSHHRPSNKLTSPNQVSISIKNNSEKPNKTNITDEKMDRVKPLNQIAGAYQGGHQNCRVGSMARANQPRKMVCFGCIFHQSPPSSNSE